MKPYAKLTRIDLAQSPIWEWAPEDDGPDSPEAIDESYVRSTPLSEIPLGPFAQYVVAISVELRNGDCMPGIAEVVVADSAVSVQPTTVLLLDRHLRIPGVETNRLLARYTQSIESYPVAWRLAVTVQGETQARCGEIKAGDMKDLVALGEQMLLSLKALREK